MMVGMAERLAAQEKLAVREVTVLAPSSAHSPFGSGYSRLRATQKSETLFYEFCVASGLCQDTQYW